VALTNFVPEIWAAQLLMSLKKSLVYGAAGVVNRDYEGDIEQYGDTVHITSITQPTIGTYTAHTDITVEDVDDADRTLVVDQSKYFAFEVDDIEARQARGNALDGAADEAAYGLRDVADQYLAGLMSTDVDAGNQVAEATLASAADAYDALVDLAVLLDGDNVPSAGRWAVITPAFHGLLLKDTRFIAAGDAQGAATRANGIVGEAAGFTLHKSNNAPAGPGAGAGKQIIAGHPIATSYAEQIAKVEAFRLEKRFADGLKGLHLYGAKVTRPTALAAADVII
jgi:hypothetical protein